MAAAVGTVGEIVKLALYHPWVYLTGGIERTLLELLQRSRHDWTLYTHHFEPEATFPGLAEHRVVELSPRVSVRRSFAPLVHAAWSIGRTRLPDDGSRALLVSSEGMGDLMLARNPLPAACFCHTPLKILHDPATRERLEEGRPAAAAALKVLGPAFHAVDRRMFRRYRHVFANSLETAERLGRSGLALEGRVEVLYPGVALDRFAPRPGPRRRTLLVAGRLMWQKNVELAIDALALARQRHGVDLDMVVAGAVDAKSQAYAADLRRRAAGLPVSFEVDPSDDRLAELYATCLAVVFPALNEDWGIVPLEAMASGTPVLAVSAGGPTESVVDGVTGWLRPPDPVAFAEPVAALAAAGEALEPMRRAARERALLFGWDRFVARLDDAMEACATMASSGLLLPDDLDLSAAAPASEEWTERLGESSRRVGPGPLRH